MNDFNFVGSGRNGEELLELLKNTKVDVIITDIAMPKMNGIELSSIIKKEYPEIKIVVFTMYLENWFINKLKKIGVMGYVSKNSKLSDLIYAIRKVYNNEVYYCRLFKEKMCDDRFDKVKLKDLSQNEEMILRMFKKFMNSDTIAAQLMMSEKSVETYLRNIIIKLNVSNRNALYLLIEKSNNI